MSTIDEVKQRLDIADIISGYLPLQKAGHNFRALCPFHIEKTPSFFVFPERQSWHCFGCGAGGDAFGFVMKKENLAFGDALRLLAQRVGVTLERPERASEQDREVARLAEINEAAAQYYHNLLLTSKAAQETREYLGKRGFNEKSTLDFQLGYSLDSWEALRQHLVDKGYSEAELVKGGLLISREGGGSYDRFRHRLMFPIRDIKGRVVGFGARALDDSLPKYLNSPQTLLFDKSAVLYGIDKAKGAIRQQNLAIVVEGYTDVLMAHQNGINNVVASMGTALTPRQMAILKSLTGNLSLALDADAAGEAATLRGLEVARQSFDRDSASVPHYLGAGAFLKGEIKIIRMPPGKDPDEVIRDSPEVWRRLATEAVPVVDYIMEKTIAGLDLSRDENKQAAVERLLPLISEVGDDVRRQLYRAKLARLVGITENALAGIAARLKPTPGEAIRRVVQPKPRTLAQGDKLEEYCLATLLQNPEIRELGQELSPDLMERPENQEICRAWLQASSVEELRHSLDETLHPHLEHLQGKQLPPLSLKDRERAVRDCVRRLRERRLRNLQARQTELLSEAEASGSTTELAQVCYALWCGHEGGEVEPDLARLAQLRRAGIEVGEELQKLFLAAERRNAES